MRKTLQSVPVLLPPVIKKALAHVAADHGKQSGPLVRDMVTDMVKTYKGGIFFDMAVRDSGHLDHEDEQ